MKIHGIIEYWQYYGVCGDSNGIVSKILGDEWVNPRILSIQSLEAHQWAFEWVYEAEVGELGPEGMYSAVLMPILKITSNRSIVSDWEVHPNSGMADKWESNDEGEEEGVSAVDLQAGHNFFSLELGELGYPQE